MKSPVLLTAADRIQQQLAKHCFWDEFEQVLYIDARQLFPKEGVVTILGWDNMMMNAQPIPNYPAFFKILAWTKHPQYADWRKQIPPWVQDSCALFPTHQMTLLHYAGKYPQVLELLDHAPMLAWRLVTSKLQEPKIVALLSGKRADIAATVGWPGKAETVKFLTNLRLRLVNKEIAEQIETCLLDEQRLTALQSLPRINSMALSLAARFPELIGSKLHHALAQLPCRPMQCQSMIAQLEDAYRVADYLGLAELTVKRIGQCRYLVEVNELYQAWLMETIDSCKLNKIAFHKSLQTHFMQRLTAEPSQVHGLEDWVALTQIQQHVWLTDYANATEGKTQLVAWQDEEGIWGALIHSELPQTPKPLEQLNDMHKVIRVRGLENVLAGPKQHSTLHLWQAKKIQIT
ncbi:hypothetical protein [Thiomicrorhabdus sp. Kp2]|uniref:hypothetical protein n=1 Tax=Thiomicrorhabdus sp. Kp2 TaxID=1123518 RepID=UPI00040DBED9|nr:hypothetical protein [Thiomicrorhabdus sp. Kp2]